MKTVEDIQKIIKYERENSNPYDKKSLKRFQKMHDYYSSMIAALSIYKSDKQIEKDIKKVKFKIMMIDGIHSRVSLTENERRKLESELGLPQLKKQLQFLKQLI